jgi:hypothetical protein
LDGVKCLIISVVWSFTSAIGQDMRIPDGYWSLYATHFNAGLDPNIDQQKPTEESITVVDAPGKLSARCVRVTMRRTDDFSKVANGAPRSELSFGRQFRIQPGKDYLFEWSTFLPADHQFDHQQLESITQIHHGLRTGSPPFMVVLNGDRYQVEVRGGASERLKKSVHPLGSANIDHGKWVMWRLHYRADASGANAVLKVFKNEIIALDASGEPNAYADDTQAYWKMGI